MTHSARRRLAVAQSRAGETFARAEHHVRERTRDSALIDVGRPRLKSGSWDRTRLLRVGPNAVHCWVGRSDGSIDDMGVSHNLLTNIGRDVWSGQWGFIGAGVTTASPGTTITSSSVTVTGTPLTASNLATPQLGVAGLRIYASVTGVTTPPVYGNIISNTTSAITIDKWWNVSDTTGTTPANTNAFIIAPAGIAGMRFVAFSTNASAASASDTTLANEVTTNGLARFLATYTHSFGGTTLTLTSGTLTATGTVTAVHKAGIFTCATANGGDPLCFETVFSNGDFTVANGDTVAMTWTLTPSG